MPVRTSRRRRKDTANKEEDDDDKTTAASKQKQTQQHEHTDRNHNCFDFPSCRLLQEIVGQIWPCSTSTNTTNSTSTSTGSNATSNNNTNNKLPVSPFAALLRQHLIMMNNNNNNNNNNNKNNNNTTTATTANNKKKKKKKKRKKTTTTSTDDTTSATEENGQPQEPPQKEQQPQQEQETVSPLPSTQPTPPILRVPPPSLHSRREFLLSQFIARTRDSIDDSSTTLTNNSAATTKNSATRTLAEFLDYLNTHDKVCCIPPHQFQQVLQSMACHECQRSVQQAIHGEPCLSLSSILDASNNNNNNSNNSHDHHTAFDYVAMEEGMAGPPTPQPHFTGWYLVNLALMAPHHDAKNNNGNSKNRQPVETTGWKLCFQEANTKNNNTISNSNSNPWNMDSLDLWLRHGLLLGGTDPDQLMGISEHTTLSPSLQQSLVDTIDTACNEEEHFFYQLATELVGKAERFERDTKDHAAGGNIEMSSFQIMRDTQDACVAVFGKLMRHLWKTTRNAQQVWLRSNLRHQHSSSSNINHGRAEETERHYATMMALIDDLWRGYCDGMQQMIDDICEYEKQVAKLFSSQSRIPDMFCSSTMRELFRKLVKNKILITHRTIAAVHDTLNAPFNVLYPLGNAEGGWDVHLTKVIAANTAFQGLHGGGENCRHNKDTKLDPALDTAIEDTLKEILQWTTTVHQPTMQKITAVHAERRDQLFASLHHVQEELQRKLLADASSENPSIQELLRQVQYFQQAPKANGEEDGEGAEILALSSLRSNIGRGILRTISPWIRYKLEDPPDSSETPLELPFCLRRGIAMSSSGRSDCVGGNGRHRVECIFMGLLYRWLNTAFLEWQAIKAERELLTTILRDDQAKETKASKKNKKKKSGGGKKLAQEAPSSARSSIQASASDDKEGGSEKVTVISLGSEDHEKDDDDAATPKEAPQSVYPTAAAKPDLPQEAQPTDEALKSDSEDVSLLQDQDIQSVVPSSDVDATVGVFDSADEFETAEAFLVSRLDMILKRKNVVVISG